MLNGLSQKNHESKKKKIEKHKAIMIKNNNLMKTMKEDCWQKENKFQIKKKYDCWL